MVGLAAPTCPPYGGADEEGKGRGRLASGGRRWSGRTEAGIRPYRWMVGGFAVLFDWISFALFPVNSVHSVVRVFFTTDWVDAVNGAATWADCVFLVGVSYARRMRMSAFLGRGWLFELDFYQVRLGLYQVKLEFYQMRLGFNQVNLDFNQVNFGFY